MNKHYETALKAVVAIEAKGSNFWQNLVLFVADVKPADEAALKVAFGHEEKQQTVTKKKLSTFGAYRSAKSVIFAALKCDVALMDGEKVRGKTEVEKDIKAAKADGKTELDKFKSAMNTATLIAIKLEGKDAYAEAFMLSKALTDKLAELLKEAVAAEKAQ